MSLENKPCLLLGVIYRRHVCLLGFASTHILFCKNLAPPALVPAFLLDGPNWKKGNRYIPDGHKWTNSIEICKVLNIF